VYFVERDEKQKQIKPEETKTEKVVVVISSLLQFCS